MQVFIFDEYSTWTSQYSTFHFKMWSGWVEENNLILQNTQME